MGILVALLSWCVVGAAGAQTDDEITVYVAKKIVTMDPTNPIATAVAVRGNRVVSVGSLGDLKPWLDAHPHRIDDRFKDKVLMPGLIDPHLHPLLGAIQFGTTWITPEPWLLHDGQVPAATSPEQYLARLKQALEENKDSGEPIFITWGWQEADHGPMTKAMLDELAPDTPVMVWQRSVHEAVFNTAALDYMKLSETDAARYSASEIDWENGHFVEAGFFEVALPRLAPYILSAEFIGAGFDRNTDYLVSGGITTVGDLATGQVDWNLELATFKQNLIDKNVPYRTVIVPAAHVMALANGGLDQSFQFIDDYLTSEAPARQLVHGKRIKLFADGAMFSQAMQLSEPGYIDGHAGEWITPQEDFEAQARKYWNEGYRIHVHANGDEGIRFTLDVFEQLQAENSRGPNALVIEHFGYADEYVIRRIADFGATVSANPYYLTGLGDSYAEDGLGPERARRIAPLAGLADRGVPIALHSDFGMAPARPLYLAWSAMTRETLAGETFAPPRGLTRDEALKAVTVDAAYILGLEQDLGSIQSGKLADFAVLEADPTTVDIDDLKDLAVWGVVFEGEVRQAPVQ
ncbi:MAG: amidohydrolase [Hyphomicrobiales bacterium]|nr:amidohydrolase [Hyphomicrobiales bacterium]